MSRFSFILAKKINDIHNADGKFGNKVGFKSKLSIAHATRYDAVTESAIIARNDLGYFKSKRPRIVIAPSDLDKDATWHGAEDTLISKLSKQEHNALNEYTGTQLYSRLNKAMVTGKTTDPELYAKAKAIYAGIHKSEIPEDVTLFRGMQARGLLLDGESSIGKIYSDKIFKSTSVCQDNAIQFAVAKQDSVILRIKARKGQQGAYLDGKLSQNPQEQEVLLSSNSKFLITGHSILKVNSGLVTSHIKVYDCEML